MTRATELRLAVIVPCRNEAAVIERKLLDLAHAEWPASARPHHLLVVDDHSSDDTLARAQAVRGAFDGVAAELRIEPSGARPGKNGALAHGLQAAAGQADLLVITDADVLIDPRALLELAAAFAQSPRLGMACGEQVFVESLANGTEGPRAAAGWDRWTARARRLESRFGMLFSVHGQLLAWRAELDLVPRPGVAADDVDLMLQVRASASPEVRLVAGARFFEEKKRTSGGGREQALRRARAWFQVFEGRERPAGFEGWRALQWLAYSKLPGLLPWIATLATVMLLTGLYWALGAAALGLGALVLFLVAASPAGREWLEILWTIAKARRLERRGAMEESWETTRT